MSVTTIEQLQRIVADESRTEEDRRQAAEHIIQLQEAGKEPAPIKEQEAEANLIKRIFDAILERDRSDSKQRQEEKTMRVCTYCFRLQGKENATCELCGEAGWLIPSVAKSNPEYEMFIRMAAGYTIEQLEIALYSGWARTAQREQVARRLLASRKSKEVIAT
jgi:hypothetical protein